MSFTKPFSRSLAGAGSSSSHDAAAVAEDGNRWIAPVPFILLNLSVLLVFWAGISWVAVAFAAALYVVRMFGITAVYHRYFSHRTYKTSRPVQFLLAFLGNTAAQRGPLWWAAHHRHHHAYSDTPDDTHSPIQEGGFLNSHVLWWGRARNMPTRLDQIKDFAKFPELVFLNNFDWIAPVFLGTFSFFLGKGLARWFPGLHTTGFQMLVWFFISTVVLFHGVATINSLAHVFGARRFRTEDQSRNNFWLALITLGEGWHNNHHHYPNSARQGFYWWEIDVSYYVLKGMEKLGLVWDLKPVPRRILEAGRAPARAKAQPAGWVSEPAPVLREELALENAA